MAASIEAGSEHPLALAIMEKAEEKEISIKSVTEFHNRPGYGVEAIFNNEKLCCISDIYSSP